MAELAERLPELEALAASRDRSAGELLDWMIDALQRTPAGVSEPGRELSESGVSVLKEEGIDPDLLPEGDPLMSSGAAYLTLLDEALSAKQAAARLKVSPSRIRQRLLKQEIYGVKAGRDWRLPAWQFTRARLVPGLDSILPRLSPDLHPLTVQGFFSTPQPELIGTESEPVPPLRWLLDGGDPAVVAALGEDL